MTSLYKMGGLITLLMISAALLACHGKTSKVTTSTQSHFSLKEAKPGAPVKLISPTIILINANTETSIEIELQTTEPDGELEIDLVPTPGINIISGQPHQTLSISNNLPLKFPLTLLAQVNGRYYVNMRVKIKNAESQLSRTLALIVQVGEKEEVIQRKKTSGENVISLPAQENISSH